MATTIGRMFGSSSSSSWTVLKDSKRNKERRNNKFNVSSVYSPSVSDPYQTLKINPCASESEVKKAFRQLALQYHPDVCRGNNCGVQFHQINEAYDVVMTNLREGEESGVPEMEMYYSPSDAGIDEPMRGMNDGDWDMWEEWMGWEGAGIRDYTSHINPYI